MVILRPARKIRIEDMNDLYLLLKSGLSLKEAVSLLDDNDCFEEILEQLNRGGMIEDIIGPYLPKSLSNYMKEFLKKLSFSDSLALSLFFYQKTRENEQSIEKAVLYPLVLLFLSLSGLYLFDLYGLDAIVDLLSSFSKSGYSFSVFRLFFRIIINLFFFGFLLLGGLFLYFNNNKRLAFFYILICRYLRETLFKMYYSEEFISLLLVCNQLGYKTRDALAILKGLKDRPVTALMAFHLDNALMTGLSLKEGMQLPYFDKTLTRFVEIGVQTRNFDEIMNNYIELTKEKITRKTKTMTLILQIGAYFFIAIVIIFVYQIMFMPMQALANF